MNHTVNKLDGDILALMPWVLLHTKNRILLPEGIWNCTSSSQFSPRHPCSPLAAEYLISWSISIINLSNRNNKHKIISSALVIRIALLISIKSISDWLICARWEFYPDNRHFFLSRHAYYLEVQVWVKKIITGYESCYELCKNMLQERHILLHEAKNLLLKPARK